jgi:hypothetical protein
MLHTQVARSCAVSTATYNVWAWYLDMCQLANLHASLAMCHGTTNYQFCYQAQHEADPQPAEHLSSTTRLSQQVDQRYDNHFLSPQPLLDPPTRNLRKTSTELHTVRPASA